ncbi:pyridoxamine 5'-phosphate oxidase family protein [Rhodobacterales bacterium HKCCE3408]|nr:pyridoxamine 5'-phosphate oxidase family protein [Rhodobacterales bacterium HKCCE3408]
MPERFSSDSRTYQDRFGTRRFADTLDRNIFHPEFNEDDRTMIGNARFFFLSTVDAVGQPQCSYKGGPEGFVKITGPSELVFPLYDGNGMYLSAGNISATGKVGLLFVDFENQRRKRVNGTAEVLDSHPALDGVVAAQLAVRVSVDDIHPNCPRNVHKMAFVELSQYTPKAPEDEVGYPPWADEFPDDLPEHLKRNPQASDKDT